MIVYMHAKDMPTKHILVTKCYRKDCLEVGVYKCDVELCCTNWGCGVMMCD